MMNRRGSGKISGILILLLMINIIGYIEFTDFVSDSQNPYITNNLLITTLFDPYISPDGGTVYLPGEDSALGASIPRTPSESFIEAVGGFIDRIFALFEFIRTMVAVLSMPIVLISFLGLPWQLAMLLFPPLATLYAIGFIDLLGGGDN